MLTYETRGTEERRIVIANENVKKFYDLLNGSEELQKELQKRDKEELIKMTLTQTREGSKCSIKLEGVLNTHTAPDLAAVLGDNLNDVDELIFDISDLEYTSSAGLRCFLEAQQIMDEKDARMIVRGANDLVMGLFRETGFDKIMDIR